LREPELVGLEIRAPQELGRAGGDAVVPEVDLELGDQVGSDDGQGRRGVTELRDLAYDWGGESPPQDLLVRESGLRTCASDSRSESS
jgi:hypothetical protein